MRSAIIRSTGAAAAVAVALWFSLAASAGPARAEIAPGSDFGTASPNEPCGSQLHLEAQLARDPELAARRAMFEAMMREAEKNGLVPRAGSRGNSTNALPIYTIPVVVHVVHSGLNGDPENIPDAQIQSQIAAINRDCQNLPNSAFPADDCQLQFCLASVIPQGSSSTFPGVPGITRTLNAGASVVQLGNAASETALKAIDYFPSNRYLNVWVVKQITGPGNGSGVIGFATFPGSVPATLDGIVMDYRVMGANNTGWGTNFALLPTYEEGKVFAHEVGHWLNLYHTFQGGCSGGDFVADTPPEALNHWGCPSGVPVSCSNSGDPFHNFMDYTNDPCRWEFTAGQRSRMHAAITNWRQELVSPPNLVNTGACPPTLFAFITATPSQACINVPIQLSSPACGGCTFAWSFPGGTGNATGQTTSVTYPTPGAYPVTLTVTNGSASTTATTTVYVSACAPITGPCTNWVFGNQCRLTFASGVPVAVPGTANLGPETGAQISDAAGNLLFYTDNRTIWDASNFPMSNSGGFFTSGGGRSCHTGALIVPRPSTPNEYFLFSVNEWEKYPSANPLSITTIDMTLNGGLGAVTNTCVPILLPVGVTLSPRGLVEGVTLIPHCNATDWWLITCGADNTNSAKDWTRFVYVTLITSAGAGPTTQYAVGFGGAGGGASAWGTLTASKDGTRLAICQADTKSIRVYDFDRSSGTPVLYLDTGNIGCNQDVAFSPDAKIVYYAYLQGLFDINGNGQYGLRQMDLASQQVRILRPHSAVPIGPQDVQLGPDDKVYASRSGATSLDCINFPNAFNTLDLNECGLNPSSISLGGATNTLGALPNTLAMCSASAPPAAFTYAITNCYTVTFKSPNCSPWSWNFGDNSPLGTGQTVVHTYANTGIYQVTLTAASASPTTLTIPVTIGALPISIAGPNSTCGGPSNYSVVGPSNYTYVWTITGGTPTTATGNNVFVSWGQTTGVVSVVGTDPATGCTSMAGFGLEACMICATPPDDIIAWWPLDEPSGTLAQEIVNARNGQDFGAPLKPAGVVASARQFNASTQWIRVPDDAKLDLGTSSLTLDAWIQTSTANTWQGIVEKRSLSPDQGYALYLKQGRLALLLGDGTSGTEFTNASTAILADGKWHHVAATTDRANSATGTTLYVDGSPIVVLPGYSATANLDNAEDLLIGAQEPSSAPVWGFDGKIDEVEIFDRALTAQEINDIWGAGPAGKCKELAYVPTGSTICPGQGFVLVTMYLCNYGATPQTYSVNFAGGTSGPGCTFFGPTTFTILGQSNNLVTVASGSCQPIVVKIDRPIGMVSGQVWCYTMTSMNTSTNVSRVTRGSLWANDSMCPILTSGGLGTVGVNVPIPVGVGLVNSSPVAIVVGVGVEARQANFEPVGPGGPPPIVSLNGLPPGVPWIENFVLAPGESTHVAVEAMFMDAAPFRLYDVVFSIDTDGNGSTDAEVAVGLLNSEHPLGVVGVPPDPTAPARFELLGASPNPFHRLLGIEFMLSQAGPVRLELYDVKGRRVRTMPEAEANAGRNLRMIDAGGLPGGVYFVRLEAEGQRLTRRVVLLRE